MPEETFIDTCLKRSDLLDTLCRETRANPGASTEYNQD